MTDAKTLLRESCLPTLSKECKYFTTSAIRGCLARHQARTQTQTVNRYLVELVKAGTLFDAGRGWYSSLAKPLAVNPAPIAEVIGRVEKAFPLLEFSCWSTEQVNPYMQHLLTKFVTFIYTDKDLMPSVFEEISTWKDFRAYLKPGAKEAKTFRVEERTIVIRQETSEAPSSDGHVAPFEKLLVDLAVEIEQLPLTSKGEFQEMAWRVITSGRVQMAVLARYARRNHRTLEDVFGRRWSTNGTK